MSPRRWFHLLLGAIFVPLLSLPLVWGAALYCLRRAADVEARRWARRLLALAVVDTVVVVVGGFVVAADVTPSAPPAAAEQDHVAIGVTPDLSFGGPGTRVQDVVPGSPAAAAGVAPGDVILRVGTAETPDPEELRRVVRAQEPDVPVAVTVARGTSTSTMPVTPRWSSEIRRQSLGLFEPAPASRGRSCFPRVGALAWLPTLAMLAVTVALAVVVRRRTRDGGAARAVWWTGASLAAAAIATYAAPAGACLALGGQTAAGLMSSLWGSSLALAGTALVARRFVPARQGPAPSRTWPSAVALGAWYLVTGAPRVAVFVAAAIALAAGQEPGSHPIESLAQGVGASQGPGLLLLAVPAILFAPVGEELAFRGLLQPALGGWLRPAASVAVTSVLFAAMHWHYGLKLPLILLVALVLGWARNASGGLRAPIALHMLVNAVGFVPFVLAAARGG